VTNTLSQAGVPMMADVIVHYDGLNCEYSEMCLDTQLPLWIRQAANRRRQVLNKYYKKTNESELYRLAMLLHPSMRIHYFKAAGWEKDWIDTAVEIAEKLLVRPLQACSKQAGDIVLDPLAWWYGQRCAGNEYLGLTQMALDVLTLSVDVERAFLFTGSIVSKRRHNLAPATIEAAASLGSYSKAGLVRPGILVLPLKGKATAAAAKAGKGRGAAKAK
ncbi:hypothetical protein BDV93DRAFT_437625, partial [Ceratobasidium sp. AG-I]